MEHVDESILKIKKALEEEKNLEKPQEEAWEKELTQSIYDEVTEIYEIPVHFEEKEIFDGRARIYMPEEFELVPEEVIKEFYFMGNPPKVLYSSDESKFSIGFNWTEHVIANEHVWDFLKAVRQMLEKNGPKTRILNTDKWEKDGHKYASIEFISQAIDMAVYNHMFYAILEGKMLIGFINCPSKYNKRIKSIAQEVIKSFCVMDKEVEI